MSKLGDRRRYLPTVDTTASSAYTNKLSFGGTGNLKFFLCRKKYQTPFFLAFPLTLRGNY